MRSRGRIKGVFASGRAVGEGQDEREDEEHKTSTTRHDLAKRSRYDFRGHDKLVINVSTVRQASRNLSWFGSCTNLSN